MGRSPGQSEFVEPTLYQGATFIRASMLVYWAIAALFVASAIGGSSTSGQSPDGVLRGLVLLACIGGVWYWRARHLGIRIESSRLVAVYAIGARRYSLEEVAGFSMHRYGSSGGTHVVFIELTNGKRRKVVSVCTADWGPCKSDSIRWPGGRSDQVLTRLTDHLAHVRTAHTTIADGREGVRIS